MYISALRVVGYKNTRLKSDIYLNKGLNVLVGENGSGKTAIINACRLLLRESESYCAFSEDDFFCSLDKTYRAEEAEFTAEFSDLSEDEKITFLTWCESDFDARLHLQITKNPSRQGYYKRKYWGGNASASIFEEDTFDRIECIYLPPLRDAEHKLANGRRSRLSLLLEKQYGENKTSLVESVKGFNDAITQNSDGKFSEIQSAKRSINSKIKEAMGNEFAQSVNLQFSEISFSRIIENIQMVFFPKTGESDIARFRDLATNSLGYNNLLYIATVFAELELIKDSDVFTVLLIEEPEAHLHPQLQVKFIKYLEKLSETLPNSQIIVSSHLPVLASSISIDKIIHISERDGGVNAIALRQKTFGDTDTVKFLNRWLDVTKSTMFFSRGIIMVEGISEALLLPRLAEKVLEQYSLSTMTEANLELGKSLEEMGISIVNLGGIYFKSFMKLFANFDNAQGSSIPIYCSGMTDRDPKKDVFPMEGESVLGENPTLPLVDNINKNEHTRLFVSPLKTFEYDLAMQNPVNMASVLQVLWPTADGTVHSMLQTIIDRGNKYEDDPCSLRKHAEFIYKHIDDSQIGKGLYAHALAEKLDAEFIVPPYIRNAVLWACGGVECND